jgi:hypothetical protein
VQVIAEMKVAVSFRGLSMSAVRFQYSFTVLSHASIIVPVKKPHRPSQHLRQASFAESTHSVSTILVIMTSLNGYARISLFMSTRTLHRQFVLPSRLHLPPLPLQLPTDLPLLLSTIREGQPSRRVHYPSLVPFAHGLVRTVQCQCPPLVRSR